MALFYGCSTQKNTRSTRAYHELTTRYNVFFNAQDSYDQTLRATIENSKENWSAMLSMYPNSRSINDTTTKVLGGPFDRVIDKTTKAIQEHSISAKPQRDRERMNSQAYRDWLRQNEFNPFIDQVWLLMGKAHVNNGDYLEAISVFSNTIRLFNYDIDVVSEAQIWMIRAYAEIGWFSEAEVLIDGLQNRDLTKDLKIEFDEVYAFLLLKQERYEDAIPYLTTTIDNQKIPYQKRKLRFLLGQLYAKIGDNENSYLTLEKVKGINTSNEVTLYTLIAQSTVAIDAGQVVDKLIKQGKREANKDHLDLIYGAIGDFYLSKKDTVRAVDNYLYAESNSILNGLDKALVQIKLGGIFFNKKRYVEASYRYTDAVSKVPKGDPGYNEIAFRAEVLGELSPHIIAVKEQDSLQYLASLPEMEQLKIINTHIDRLKRLDRDDSFKSFVEEQHVKYDTNEYNLSSLPILGSASNTFYFYNPHQVTQGINEFKKRWGNRRLEDNWRLSSRISRFDNASNGSVVHANENSIEAMPSREIDIYTPEFYLLQLPRTPESIANSNSIIESNLYEIGNIAKNGLTDYDLAIESYSRINNDFPNSKYTVDAIYNLYIIYRQLDNMSVANTYKNRLVSKYPESEYAIMISDPEYESVMADFSIMEYALYQDTYHAYQNGYTEIIHKNYHKATRLFSDGTLMPKFRLINALSYALIGNSESLQSELNKLIDKNPNSEESIFAQNIIDGLKEGKELVDNASAISNMEWISNIASNKRELDTDYISEFITDKYIPHSLLLIFDDRIQKKNELLFAISNHNFSNYQLRSFTASFIKIGDTNAMIVKPFSSYDEANLYMNKISNDSIFVKSITDSLKLIPISDNNLSLLLINNSIDQYVEFDKSSVRAISGNSKDIAIDNQIIEDVKTIDDSVGVDKPRSKPIVIDERESITIEEKLLELEKRQEQALSQSDKPISEKDRKKQLRDREKERKELIKQRQRELKQRENARKEELKKRERDRQQKIREQEEIRKAKLNERNRILREQNR